MPQPFLTKQTYRLNMGQGLDTHTDAKTLSSGKMIVLQNAKFTTGNRLSKRDGFAAVGTADATGDKIQRLDSFGGQVVGWGQVGASGNARSFYTINSGLTSLSALSPSFNDCLVSSSVVMANNFTQDQVDSATVNGFTLYAWRDNRNTSITTHVFYKIVGSTGNIIVNDTCALSSTSITSAVARCVAVGNFLMMGVINQSSTILQIMSFDTSNAMTAHSNTTSFTNVSLGGAGGAFSSDPAACWDISSHTVASTNVALVSYVTSNTTGKVLNFATVNGDCSVRASSTLTVSTTIAFLTNITPCPGTTSTTFKVVFADTAAGSLLHYVPLNTSLTAGTQTSYATAITTAIAICGQELSDLASSVVFVSSAATTTSVPLLNAATNAFAINSSGTFSASGSVMNGLCISSKPIYIDDGNLYLWTLYPSQAQGQYVLEHYTSMTVSGSMTKVCLPAARNLFGSAMGRSGGKCSLIPVSVNKNGLTWQNSALFVSNQFFIPSTPASILQTPGIVSQIADFSYANAYHSSNLNGQMIIPGGFNALNDGAGITELGFLSYPESITSSLTASFGSLFPGTYQYVFTYEWLDALGNLHRSETSVPTTFVVSSTTAVQLIVTSLRWTLKQYAFSNRLDASLVVYRTTANASPAVFYRLGSLQNDPTANTLTFIDITPDSKLTVAPILYTQGGILDNFTIDGTSVICAGPDRLYAADPNNTGIVHVGKPYNQTDGLSFFSGITILIPTDGGPVTNMQYMDSSLVIFKARMIIIVQGQGPTANGQNNGYSPAQVISRDVGCDNPHAATLYPDGILFKSAKGYYRLGRDLSFAPASNYIGAGVESFNASSCLRAMLREDRNEARFLLSDNATILVYNYLFGQWSTIITSATDMTEVNGQFYVSSNTPSVGALVAQETVGTFTDALLSPTGIPFLITTGWCALNQLQGCQRVYRVRFLGDSKSAHTLTVKFAYDYEGGDSPTFSETHTITSTNITTGGSIWQCEAFPLRQKCEAIAIQISDGTPTGESFSLTDIELEVGVIPGRRFPLAATKGF